MRRLLAGLRPQRTRVRCGDHRCYATIGCSESIAPLAQIIRRTFDRRQHAWRRKGSNYSWGSGGISAGASWCLARRRRRAVQCLIHPLSTVPCAERTSSSTRRRGNARENIPAQRCRNALSSTFSPGWNFEKAKEAKERAAHGHRTEITRSDRHRAGKASPTGRGSEYSVEPTIVMNEIFAK